MCKAEILPKRVLAQNQRRFGINTLIHSNGLGECLSSDPLDGEIQQKGTMNDNCRFKALNTITVFSYHLKRNATLKKGDCFTIEVKKN